MAEASPSRDRLAYLAVGVAALVAVGIFVARRSDPGDAADAAPQDSSWHFSSIRAQDDPASPSNAILVKTGDRLLAWSSRTDLPCYSFLQDGTKFEVAAPETQDFDNNGVIQELAGVQLGNGKGDVQFVVVCADKPVEKLPVILATLNAFPLKPDARLEALLKTLQKQPGQGAVQISRSGWYKLNYAQPGSEGGIVGAPSLPPQGGAAAGSSLGAEGNQKGQEAAAEKPASDPASASGGGMGAGGVPAGGSAAPPVTPH